MFKLSHIYIGIDRAKIQEATSKKKKNDWFRGDGKYNSVLFVPATRGSVLANSIRKLEEANHQSRTMRVIIVQKKLVLLSRVHSP